MPEHNFINIWIDTMGELRKSCASFQDRSDADITRFMANLESISKRLTDKLNGSQTNFYKNDLPLLLYVAFLTVNMVLGISGKQKSKRKLIDSLFASINEAHKAQHQSWGELKWQEFKMINGPWMSQKMVTEWCVMESFEVAARHAFKPDAAMNDMLFAYSACLGFLAERGMNPFLSDIPSIDKLYVIEWPRRICPFCARSSHPVIASENGLDIKHGFMFKCQFCGHLYGFGGKRKPIYIDCKRVLSTAWTADKFAVDYCQFCGRTKKSLSKIGQNLESHHIMPVSEGGEDIPSNLMILCPDCHQEAHKRRLAR